MELDDIGVWGLVAAVIGGVVSVVKRVAPPAWAAKRAWKDGVLPALPILLGAATAAIPAVVRVNRPAASWIRHCARYCIGGIPTAAAAGLQSVLAGQRELFADDIWAVFQKAYHLSTPQHFQLLDYEESKAADGTRIFAGKIAVDDKEQSVSGRGNGLISSVVATIAETFGVKLEVKDYAEHAMTAGSDARAAAYVECMGPDGKTVWGVGIDEDVATASVRAVLSAANGAART
jgi:hypothetical protein